MVDSSKLIEFRRHLSTLANTRRKLHRHVGKTRYNGYTISQSPKRLPVLNTQHHHLFNSSVLIQAPFYMCRVSTLAHDLDVRSNVSGTFFRISHKVHWGDQVVLCIERLLQQLCRVSCIDVRLMEADIIASCRRQCPNMLLTHSMY